MSSSISNEAGLAPPADGRHRGRWMALALFAMAALPVAAAFLAFFFWSPGSGTNYGELIQPIRLPDAVLRAPDGARFSVSSLQGSWILVQIGGGRCAEDCVKRLFLMRQVRLMQGKEMGRLERLWLLADDTAPDAGLLQAYEGMRVGRGAAALMQLFPAEGDSDEHIYLVDPLGNLMLRFPRDADARRMSNDLARLLKVSHVG
jgi:hypothetical protein